MKQNNFFIVLLVAGFTSIMTAQVPSYVPTNGLVGYWPFNGNANDVSTNANNGINNGATLTTDRFGNVNSAYNFDGSDWIEVLNNSFFNNMSSYTISVWINKNNGVLRNEVISKDTYPQPTGDWSMYVENNLFKTDIQANNSSATIFCNSTNNVNDNNWEHYILTRNISDGLLKLFRNGINESISVGPISNIQNNSNVFFGKHSVVSLFFNGKLDDIGIWNRALTQTEITNLYNANICYQNVTVTDTLVINLGTLSYNPVTYNNSITIYPNPAKDRITIDCGTLSAVTGYQIKISNLLGQEVFSTTLNQQQYSIPLNSWTGKGIYLVTVYDANRNLLTTRKIDLQ